MASHSVDIGLSYQLLINQYCIIEHSMEMMNGHLAISRSSIIKKFAELLLGFSDFITLI
jgi:hypothetical protein